MKAAVISFTQKGDLLNEKISWVLSADSYRNTKNLKEFMQEIFNKYDTLIFIGAAGIAVRAIAPYIRSKDTDPAVIVCDETGRFVIPILSGHIGGANAAAKRLAELIGAVPVITTATDINGVWAADTWAAENGYYIENIENIKHISGALLRGETVGLCCDFRISGELPEGVSFGEYENGIVISPFLKKPFKNTLNIVPRCVCIGAGSKKEADRESLKTLFSSSGLSKNAVRCVSTIDIKKDSDCINALVEYLDVPLVTYTADELNSLDGEYTHSDFVKKTVGTDNVCERAACMQGGRLIIRKTAGDGVTMAVAADDIEIVMVK